MFDTIANDLKLGRAARDLPGSRREPRALAGSSTRTRWSATATCEAPGHVRTTKDIDVRVRCDALEGARTHNALGAFRTEHLESASTGERGHSLRSWPTIRPTPVTMPSAQASSRCSPDAHRCAAPGGDRRGARGLARGSSAGPRRIVRREPAGVVVAVRAALHGSARAERDAP